MVLTLIILAACRGAPAPPVAGDTGDTGARPGDSDSGGDSAGDSGTEPDTGDSAQDTGLDTGTEPRVDLDGDGYDDGEDCDDTDAGIHPDAADGCGGVDWGCDGDEPDCEPGQLGVGAAAAIVAFSRMTNLGNSMRLVDADGDADLIDGASTLVGGSRYEYLVASVDLPLYGAIDDSDASMVQSGAASSIAPTRYTPFMFFLLLACVPGPGAGVARDSGGTPDPVTDSASDTAGDSDTDHDSGSDTGDSDSAAPDSGDSGDSGPADPEPHPTLVLCTPPPDWNTPCDGLANPWPITSVEEARAAVGRASSSVVLEPEDFFYDINNYGCPSATSNNGSTTYTGGCSTPDHSYAGAMTVTSSSGDETYVYQDFSMTAVDGSFAWRGDGCLTEQCVGCDYVAYTFRLDVSVDHDGSYRQPRGMRTVSGRYVSTGGLTQGEWVEHVAASDEGAGDFCYTVDLESACADESEGVQTVTGTAVLEVAWNGDTECDGLGAVTLDGADAGTAASGALVTPDTGGVDTGMTLDGCDGVDDDGDGLVDEGTALAWFADADGDGQGAGLPVIACTAPAGYTASSWDCDDTRADVYAGGWEACDDGVDQDCDGADLACWLPGTLSATDADALLLGTGAGAESGTAVAAGDLDGDGSLDLVIGARARSSSADTPGVQVVLGGTTGTEWLATADVRVTSDDGSFGAAVALLPKADGTGALVVGSPYSGGDGAVFVFDNPSSGAWSYADAASTWDGGGGRKAGLAVTDAGDTDGDGVHDAVIGGEGSAGEATAYVEVGPFPSGTSALTDAPTLVADEDYYIVSAVASAGDVDGDGFDDVVLGANGSDRGAADGGAAYVLHGPFAGVLDVTAEDAILGSTAREYLGLAVAGGGDVDGDGLADVLVGTKIASGRLGSCWLVRGPAAGSGLEVDLAAASFAGTVTSGSFGVSLALGDLDGDGFADVVVGAENAADGGGGVATWRGPVSGSYPDLSADGAFAARGNTGSSVVIAADAVLAGAPDDDTSGNNAGAVWLVDLLR